ncbi:hypothetical protein PK35_05405 [Tamlana nanhaiensis]|uniref:Aspartate ammonia-lyase n=1 Tax=Neotamlana nanhaiensis TaxID=1382798 RepID=A0A0D7W2F7_9FLAO|nr:hypothetical protein PK35_05405 [Tamlana nanhaiensis]
MDNLKLNKQLSGIAGEYYVAAELSRRGYLAAITLRNSDGVDILVSNLDGDKLISIQVKSTQNKRKWILSKKTETEYSEKKYFVFVNIPADINMPPEYIIVHSKVLANHIYIGHRTWLSEPGRNGKKRNDSNVRQFDPRYFKPEELLTWDDLIKVIEN